jgi:hypothetical protein
VVGRSLEKQGVTGRALWVTLDFMAMKSCLEVIKLLNLRLANPPGDLPLASPRQGPVQVKTLRALLVLALGSLVWWRLSETRERKTMPGAGVGVGSFSG